MKEVDINNRNIILSLIKDRIGFMEDSFNFFENQLMNPFIDKEFKDILDEDLRKRWDFDILSLPEKDLQEIKENDQAFEMFEGKFKRAISSIGISYKNFLENSKEINKNKIKLKKLLEDFYIKNQRAFELDRNYSIEYSKENIQKYIVKSFEEIGVFKKPIKKLQLVLSCNFADWFLCSTAEKWSSCLSLERGMYWYTVPGIIGDLSRALLYITDGRRKNFLGIEVDGLISRSWVFLDEKNKKYVCKFYPNVFLDVDVIKKITKDNSFYKEREDIYCKNEVVPLFFDKGVFFSTYNDRTRLETAQVLDKKDLKNKKIIRQKITNDCSGTTCLNKRLNRVSCAVSSQNDCSFIKNLKKPFNEFLVYVPRVCSFCGDEEDHENRLQSRNSKLYCATCFNKKINICEECRGETEKFFLLEGKKLCYECFVANTLQECSRCGSLVKNKFLHSTEEEKICPECLEKKNFKCLGCKRMFFKEDLNVFHGTKNEKKTIFRRCKNCTTNFKTGFKQCSSCNEFYIELEESNICLKCSKE